eukprot:g2174.t1
MSTGATGTSEKASGSEEEQKQKFTKEQEDALGFLVLIILAIVAWVLFYFRAYVFWIVWVLVTHFLTFGVMVFVGAFVPGLSRLFGPQRGPRQSIKDFNKLWYKYMTSIETISYGFILYAGISVVDLLGGGYFIWDYYKSECFPWLFYYLIDLPTYFIGTIMWALLLFVGHVVLILSLFIILSGTNFVGPDIADGGDNPWWGGFDDLEFLSGEKNNLGDKNMTSEQARSYLGLKDDTVYDRKAMRKQYHRVCAKWHPDKNPNNIRAKQYFQKIQDAYELLGPKAMRHARLRELAHISWKSVLAMSVLDLFVKYIFRTGFLWIHEWPTFWFVWFISLHCIIAYALQHVIKSVATVPKLFSTYGKVFLLVLLVSLVDYLLGGKIIWNGNWPFSYLIAAPSQIPGLIDSLPFNALWLFRVHCSIRMLLRGFINVSVQIDFADKYTGDEKDHANAIVVFNSFLNICFTLVLIALDFIMYKNNGWVWRSRAESGWFFIGFSFFWSYFGLEITQAIGHESWGDFLVAVLFLAPRQLSWSESFMLGFGMYVFMRVQRSLMYTETALRLLKSSPIGPSILKFTKDLKEMAANEIEKQEEQEKDDNNYGKTDEKDVAT